MKKILLVLFLAVFSASLSFSQNSGLYGEFCLGDCTEMTQLHHYSNLNSAAPVSTFKVEVIQNNLCSAYYGYLSIRVNGVLIGSYFVAPGALNEYVFSANSGSHLDVDAYITSITPNPECRSMGSLAVSIRELPN